MFVAKERTETIEATSDEDDEKGKKETSCAAVAFFNNVLGSLGARDGDDFFYLVDAAEVFGGNGMKALQAGLVVMVLFERNGVLLFSYKSIV
jgi:hypothetical protein